ncbi:MAG TPA: N-acetylgalactosamine-6-sulfatase [Candidatus Hydrogenedentes bacterium]|nr:N-acetylgalactosamine-6-sulfatase [Candidatus Hydrogenedentota bacterium]
MLQTLGLGLGATMLPRGGRAQENAKSGAKPNIIFVLADDLGYGELGCYGQKVIRTPHLDQMAREGMRFTQCYAGSTVCAPSRCCLMTGLHTGHAFTRGNGSPPLPSEEVTVAELLKQAGYATAIIGKWGLGDEATTGIPNRQGFDYWFGYLNQRNAHNYYPAYLWRNEERFPLEGNVQHEKHANVAVEREQYSHDLFTEQALDYITQHKDRLFFLYLAYTIPHANNERGRFDGDGMEIPDYGAYVGEDWPDPQKGHAAMISRLDADVGRLFERLEELGIDENTLVLFTSDNGPHKEGGADPAFFGSSGPLRGYKRDLYEGGIRVPGIARWPGRVKPGATSDHPWAFWDFLPTALDLAGAPIPDGIDGISFVPALLGGDQSAHEYLYWEFHERGFTQAVRTGPWKAVSNHPEKPLELYDLNTDIGETNDVAAENPEVVARIETYLETARTPSKHWPGKPRT